MPAKDDTDAPPPRTSRPPRFHRVGDEEIQRAARRIVRSGRATYGSQTSFREAVLAALRRDDPLVTVSGTRLRRLSLKTPGVRLVVRYAERPRSAALSACPVCGGELRAIRNRTLTGGSTVLGQQCVDCEYWTHRTRRVPTRYYFSRGERRRAAPG